MVKIENYINIYCTNYNSDNLIMVHLKSRSRGPMLFKDSFSWLREGSVMVHNKLPSPAIKIRVNCSLCKIPWLNWFDASCTYST